MRPPCAQPGVFRDDPIAFLHVFYPGAGGEDFEAGFVAGDGGGVGRTERGGEGGARGVCSLDLVDVGGIEGGGEGAQG